MVAGQLEIQLLANIARLSKDMNDAKKVVSSTMGNIDRVVGATTKVLGAFGIGLSVNYFGKMIKGAIDAQDNLSKMSQKVGVSVTALAGLEHAASLSGVGMAGLEKGLKAISTQMFDASKGMATAQENFAALGINVNDAAGALKSADAVMIEVADQFKAMEDGTTKTALATKLFGRAGLDLIPMLNEGSAGLASMVAEGQRLNPVTAESAKQAEIYNDNMERLSKTASAFGIILVNKLLPVISDMSEQMVAFTQSDKFGELLRDITTAAEILAAILLTRLVVSLGATTAGFVASTYQSLAYQAALARMAGISTAAAIGTTALAGTMGALNSAMMLVGGPVGALILITAGLALMIGKMETAKERTDSLRDSMRLLEAEELQKQIKAMESNVRNIEATIARYESLNQAVGDTARQLKKQRDRLEEEKTTLAQYQAQMKGVIDGTIKLGDASESTTAIVEDLGEALQESMSDAEYLEGLYAGIAVSVTNTAAAYLELAGISRDTSKDMADYAAMIDGAVKQIPTSLVKVGETSNEVSEQAARDWAQFRDSFSDSLADMLMDGGNVFDDLGKSFERMLYKMAGDLIASGVMSFLTGQKGGFSVGNSLSGAGIAGQITSAGIGKFAPALASSLGIGGTAAAGAGVLTEAGYVAMMSGGTAAAGGAAAGGGIMAGAGSALAAVPVAGWVALAALAAYKVFAKEETPSFNAGLLLQDVPGAKANQKFDVDPFASGLDPVGFMRDQTKDAATAVIDTFRELDKTIVGIADKAGLKISANAGTFTGLDERGLGSGVFLGSAGEEGKPGTALSQQLDQYTKQLISTLAGQLDGEVLNRVLSSGNAEQMVAQLNKELSMVEDTAGDAAQGIADAAEVLRAEIDLLTESKESLAATQALEAMSLNGSSFGGAGGTNYGTQYTNGIMTQGDAFRQAANDRIETGVANGQLASYWENGVQYAGTKFTPESDADGALMYGPKATPAALQAQVINDVSTANAIGELKAVVQSLLTSINNNTRASAARLDEINGEGVYTRAV